MNAIVDYGRSDYRGNARSSFGSCKFVCGQFNSSGFSCQNGLSFMRTIHLSYSQAVSMNKNLILAFVAIDMLVVSAFVLWWKPWQANSKKIPTVGVQLVGRDLSLAEQFASAHQRSDIEAIYQLVCWDGVDDFTAESVKTSLLSDLKQRLVQVEFQPCDSPPSDYEVAGVRYQPNLRVEGHLVVETVVDGMPSGSKYLVGSKGGIQLIATAAAVASEQ